MDIPVVLLHVVTSGKHLVAGRAGKFLIEMLCPEVFEHVGSFRPSESLVATGVDALNSTSNRPLVLATWNFLATPFHVDIKKVLRGEGCFANWAGNGGSLVVLGPRVGVVSCRVDS